MSSKRSTNAQFSDSVLELFGSQSRQFVELGRELSFDELVKGIIKLSEELGTEGRKRVIQAFTDHNRIAELEDHQLDRFRRSGFDFTRPNAKSSNYSVKLYWWDREKTQRQYISTIPFKPGQVVRMTHRSTGEVRVMLCEGLYTDRSLFELVPAIKQYRQVEVQNRRARKQTKQQEQVSSESNTLPPDLGIQLRLRQIFPNQQFIILSYPRCFSTELNENEWQFDCLPENEMNALEKVSPVEAIFSSSYEAKTTQQATQPAQTATPENLSTPKAAKLRIDLSRQESSTPVSASTQSSQARRASATNGQQPDTEESTRVRSTPQSPINPVPTFEALALLSQLSDAPLQVIEKFSKVVLQDAQKQLLVTFDPATQQLTSHYTNAELMQLMQKLVTTTFRRSDATEEQKQVATRLRIRLQGANHQKPNELLYYLMGTPSKRRKLTFDDRSN